MRARFGRTTEKQSEASLRDWKKRSFTGLIFQWNMGRTILPIGKGIVTSVYGFLQ